MKTIYDIVMSLIRTEKGADMEAQRKFIFQVVKTANKIEIKKAVEEIYNVKVDSVNTITMPAKLKRVRQEYGHTTPWKKAVVTLKDGYKIDVT